MAVEAPHNHTNLFPPQFLSTNPHRDMMKPNQQMPSSTMPEPLFPLYNNAACDPNSINKADSGLTYHPVLPSCRKRSRESSSIATDTTNALPHPHPQKINKLSSSPFLDQDLLYQSEIDRLISQHTERVRVELEEQRVRQSRALLLAIQEAVVKKMKEKEEEVQRIGKLNWALQERVRTLCLENQVWRELAQTNEATANSLRSNLEQVLAHVSNGGGHDDDDAQSSCGSNHCDDVPARMCKNCGERESIVLLLPCRHLSLCTMCGSTVRDCPLCHSGINASVHVNLS